MTYFRSFVAADFLHNQFYNLFEKYVDWLSILPSPINVHLFTLPFPFFLPHPIPVQPYPPLFFYFAFPHIIISSPSPTPLFLPLLPPSHLCSCPTLPFSLFSILSSSIPFHFFTYPHPPLFFLPHSIYCSSPSLF